MSFSDAFGSNAHVCRPTCAFNVCSFFSASKFGSEQTSFHMFLRFVRRRRRRRTETTMIFSVCGARPCFESVLRAREIERERETPTRENVNLNPISLPKPPLCERALTLLFVSSARTLWNCVVLLRDDCCSILVSRDQKLNPERDRVERERGTKRCVCVRACEKRVPAHGKWRKQNTQ